MFAQGVELVAEGEGQLAMGGALLDAVEAGDEGGDALFVVAGVGFGVEFVFEKLQFAIPAIDPRTHAPVVDGRQHLGERDDHGDERQQHHEQPIDQHREPEGQVALQERRTAVVEALGHGMQRQGVILGRGKGIGGLEHAGGAVDFAGVLEEQGDDGRVDVGLDDQIGGGGKQLDVAGRAVALDVDGAAGQDDLDQMREVAHVALGLGEVEQADAFGVEQGIHDRRLGRTDHEEGVHLAAFEGVDRIHAAERGSEYLREFKITRKSFYGSVLFASALGNF